MPKQQPDSNRKKPNCQKGKSHSCGYSCISLKKRCSDNINPKAEVVVAVVAVIPEVKAKKIEKAASVKSTPRPSALLKIENIDQLKEIVKQKGDKPVTGAIADLDPSTLKLKYADLEAYRLRQWSERQQAGIKEMVALAESKGMDRETAVVVAVSTQVWYTDDFRDLSPHTYKPSKESNPHSMETAVLTGVVAGLKILPKLSADDPDLKADRQYSQWDKKTLNRFIGVDNIDEFAAKYKPGSTVTEEGLTGTTMRDPTSFAFAKGANVRYRIKPKLDGTGKGHFVDGLKTNDYKAHGQVLYEPGTSFKVAKITKIKRPPLSGVTPDKQFSRDRGVISSDNLDQTLKYIEDNDATLRQQYGDDYKDKLFAGEATSSDPFPPVKFKDIKKAAKGGGKIQIMKPLHIPFNQLLIDLEE